MLDINLFREEKGGNPELVRESQRRRFADVSLVDDVISIDKEWRQALFEAEELKSEFNRTNKEVGKLKKAKENADELIAQAKAIDVKVKETAARAAELEAARLSKLRLIGNIVPDSVPVSNDEEENAVINTFGECEEKPMIHVDIMQRLDWIDTDAGTNVAGGRGYFLKNEAVLLNQALINYGLGLLVKHGFVPLQTPFFMEKALMQECAQLEDFDEELYHVVAKSRGHVQDETESSDKYLIATSEQPISCYHHKQRLGASKGELPLKYVGYSTCFRKEAGSHGRDTAGIFRIHQFEKVEMFCITSPHDDDSEKMHEEMTSIAREFYESLQIPYRQVAIVSGALNNAAAKKYDIEAWFPGSKAFRELVSASNCTDFQSRRLDVRFGPKVKGEAGHFVHMLNSTLCATERAMCCLVENYQTEDGVQIPEVLVPYMHGITEVKFRKELVAPKAPKKKGGK